MTARYLQVVQLDAVRVASFGSCQHKHIVVGNFFLLVGQLQELLVDAVQFGIRNADAQHFESVLQGCTSRTRCENNGIVVHTHILRIDDFVGLHILQHTVLMYSAGMGKGVSAHNGLVRLHRHVHQRTDHATCGMYLARIDIGLNIQVVVAFQNHSHFFFTGVAGAFADTVDGNFHLPCAVEHTLKRASRRHAQVVVAVGGDNRTVDAVDVLHEVTDFGTVFARQAIACGVGYIHDGGSCLDDSFYDTRQIFVVGASGVFGIELHVLHIAFGILHGSHGTFDNLLTRRVKLVADVAVAGSDAGVNAFALGKLQCLGCAVDVFLHGTGQRTNGGPCYGFRNLDNGIEITGRRNGEAGFDYIHAECFKLLGHLNFLNGIELTPRHLFAIAQGGVEYVKSVAHIFILLFRFRLRLLRVCGRS